MPIVIPIYEFEAFTKRMGDTDFGNEFWMGALLKFTGNSNGVLSEF